MTDRPTEYTKDIGDKICARISEEAISLRKVCAEPDMPSPGTVYGWLNNDPAFAEQYARAREAQMDIQAEEILEIADDMANDTHTTKYGDGTERVSPNTEWISRSRVRIDTRKWLMSKLAPKKYADKIVQQHTGADGGPLTVSWKKPE